MRIMTICIHHTIHYSELTFDANMIAGRVHINEKIPAHKQHTIANTTDSVK